MRPILVVLLAVATASTIAAQSAPSVAETLAGPERAELMRVRKAVWVNWFAGDTAALRRVLAPELVAISPDSKLWQSRDGTLAGSAAFKASGSTLESVTFANDSIHRFGDVAVMFSRFTLVINGSGTREVQTGRATEVFVRRSGRWVHTSWHLDATE